MIEKAVGLPKGFLSNYSTPEDDVNFFLRRLEIEMNKSLI
jgi:hypothetical protein